MGVEVGDWLLGLRSNDAEVVEVLRDTLAPIRVDGVAVFPNLSLYRGSAAGRTRELHRLYVRGASVLHTPSLGRLLRAALRHLDGFLPPPAGLVPLRGDLLIGRHGAVLANQGFRRPDLPERRLAKLGWHGTDGAAAFFDPATGEVVIPELRLPLAPDGLAEIDRRWPGDEGEPGAAPGRYPVHAVVLLGTRPDHLLVASPARRRAGLASLIDTTHRHARARDVEVVGALDGRVDVVRVLGYDTGEIVDVLRDLAS